MVCQLVILTVQGILLCGATGDLISNEMLKPGYQRIFDSERSSQYCVPTDDVERAMDMGFSFVVRRLRADSVPLSAMGQCPR